jgi:hypothetical protein
MLTSRLSTISLRSLSIICGLALSVSCSTESTLRRPGKAALRGEILGVSHGDYVVATEDGSLEYVPKDTVSDIDRPGKVMLGVGAAILPTVGQINDKTVDSLLLQNLQLSALGLVVYVRSLFLQARDLSKVSLVQLEQMATNPAERSGWVGGYLSVKEGSGSYWGYEYKPSRWAFRTIVGVLSLSVGDKSSYGAVAGLGVAYGRRNRIAVESTIDNAYRRDVRLGELSEPLLRQTVYTMSLGAGYEHYFSRNVFIRATIGPGYRLIGPQFFEQGETRWHVAGGFAAGMKL